MARGTKGPIESTRPCRALHFYVDGTGTAALNKGKAHAALTDNGTGDYTLTFTRPGAEFLGMSFSPITKVYHQLQAAPTGAAVRILTFNDGGSATDADFFVTVFLADSAYDF